MTTEPVWRHSFYLDERFTALTVSSNSTTFDKKKQLVTCTSWKHSISVALTSYWFDKQRFWLDSRCVYEQSIHRECPLPRICASHQVWQTDRARKTGRNHQGTLLLPERPVRHWSSPLFGRRSCSWCSTWWWCTAKCIEIQHDSLVHCWFFRADKSCVIIAFSDQPRVTIACLKLPSVTIARSDHTRVTIACFAQPRATIARSYQPCVTILRSDAPLSSCRPTLLLR